jgi:hypothetical protein
MRPTIKTLFIAPALVLAAACSKDKPVDPSLNNDLSLAAQARPGMTLDSLSAAERMNGGVPANGLRNGAPAPVAAAPAPRRTTTSTARRSSSGSSAGRSSGSSNTTVAAEPRVEIKKNTKRDAAIGAAAGAIIGGASTRSVKGGVIGAAAGAILGGVIGNNVDVQKKRVP